ncbi:MAG: hypothetical protein Q9174_003225 [Haloplaca sp. 1 TL-2023]
MESLPLELVKGICESLDTADVQNMRLASKFFNYLASPYLLDKVQLFSYPKSFQRLLDISHHPVLSRSVTTLCYEPGQLQYRLDETEWKRDMLYSQRFKEQREQTKLQGSNESNEEYWTAHRISEEIDRRYVKYQQMHQEQQNFMTSHHGKSELEEAFSSFPNLRKFYFKLGDHSDLVTDYPEEFVYDVGGTGALDTEHCLIATAPQIRAVYASASLHNVRFRSFICHGFSWQLFHSPKEDLGKLAAVISEAEHFSLIPDAPFVKGSSETFWRQHSAAFEDGRVRDLITSTDCIQTLELNFPLFDSDDVLVELKHVVGDFTWTRLRHAWLGCMKTSEEDLIAFIERHAATLRSLDLDTIRLTSGTWRSILPRVRALTSPSCRVRLRGLLMSTKSWRTFDLGPMWNDGKYLSQPRTAKRKAIDTWFEDGGVCPLTDAWHTDLDSHSAGYYYN